MYITTVTALELDRHRARQLDRDNECLRQRAEHLPTSAPLFYPALLAILRRWAQRFGRSAMRPAHQPATRPVAAS